MGDKATDHYSSLAYLHDMSRLLFVSASLLSII